MAPLTKEQINLCVFNTAQKLDQGQRERSHLGLAIIAYLSFPASAQSSGGHLLITVNYELRVGVSQRGHDLYTEKDPGLRMLPTGVACMMEWGWSS